MTIKPDDYNAYAIDLLILIYFPKWYIKFTKISYSVVSHPSSEWF